MFQEDKAITQNKVTERLSKVIEDEKARKSTEVMDIRPNI